jgi:hypothetical protein
MEAAAPIRGWEVESPTGIVLDRIARFKASRPACWLYVPGQADAPVLELDRENVATVSIAVGSSWIISRCQWQTA